ncbi:MAG: ABC-2 family transporter protein [Chloroflexota bacterium]
MIQEIQHTWNIYRRLLGIQLRSQMQYRVSFILEILTGTVLLFMFFGTLGLVFQRFGSLGGWTLGEIAFLWGLVEMSFGIMDLIFSGFDPESFGRRVRQGTFDQLLLRPINIVVQVFGSQFTLRRLSKILQGLVIFSIALVWVDIDWTVAKLVYLPFVSLGLICFFGGLFVIGATFTFWTIESIEVMNVLTYGGSEMMAYPMHIYPDLLRRIFTFILPAIFLNYYPALYFLDKPDPLGFPPIMQFVSPLVGIGILTIAFAFWRFGIKHYQSTGS